MSAATIQIEFTPQAKQQLRRFESMPRELAEAIKRGMTRSLEITTGRIIERRLSGKGPFEPSLHKLGQVTQQLVRTTRAIPASIESTAGSKLEVVGGIGASVKYAAVHEFGSVKGNIPERAPFRTGINENLNFIRREIETEIFKTLQGRK